MARDPVTQDHDAWADDPPQPEHTADEPPRTEAPPWVHEYEDLDDSLPPPSAYKASSNGHKPPAGDDEDHTSWWPVDLSTLFSDDFEPQRPEVMARDDGQLLFYAGKCHACNGEGESGKSWFCLIACLQEINAGRHVLYVDFEDDAETVVTRLLALGANTTTVLEFFHYLKPHEPLFTRGHNGPVFTKANTEFATILEQQELSLVVLDGIAEVMGLHALDPEKNNDYVLFHEHLPRMIARTGPAVVQIDHVTKNPENRGRNAIGAVHKFNSIDGAIFSFNPVAEFGVGQHGISKVSIQRDRPGQLRQHTPDRKHIADLHLISHPDTHELTWQIQPPGEGAPRFRPTHYMAQLCEWLKNRNLAGEAPTARHIDESGLGAAKYLRQARVLLVEEGYVTTEDGPRRALLHTVVKEYREADDPLSDRFVAPTDGAEEEEF